jgi:hypothetical protein
MDEIPTWHASDNVEGPHMSRIVIKWHSVKNPVTFDKEPSCISLYNNLKALDHSKFNFNFHGMAFG